MNDKNDTLILRWVAWMLCWVAVATREDVGFRGALIALVAFVVVGLITQVAWWLTRPRQRNERTDRP